MSNTIDTRIVEMDFDNKGFERGVQTSVKSLADLKRSLDLKDSASNLASLASAGKSFSMDGISNGVQNISNRFSTMGIVGMGVLLNLTNAAMGLAQQIAKTVLGIDAMKAGFGSYETKVNAIRTVMAGTGESLEVVTQNIVDLNKYSDRTIYSFEDMTSNISKFTNAGLSSKEAATAIMGISNVAAISGANTNEAARAMYNFGQALSQGSVRLMDWKSIELANMATVEFKNQLLDTGIAMGTLKKSADGTYKTLKGAPVSATKGFNDSLQDQWLTVEVLNKVLADYASLETDIGKRANAAATEIKTYSQFIAVMQDSLKTGWTTTWELLFGNLTEATELFTFLGGAMGEVLGASTTARNGVLADWKTLGGRAEVFSAIKNAVSGLLTIVDTLKDSFKNIWPPNTGFQLLNLSKGLRALSLNFLLSKENLSELKRTFTGVAAIFDVVRMAVVAIAKGFGELLKAILPSGDSIFDFGASIGDNLLNFRNWVKENDIFNKAIAKIGGFLAIAAEKVKLFGGFLQPVIEKIKIFAASALEFGKKFAKGISGFGETVSTNGIFVSGLAVIKNFVDSVKGFFSEFGAIDLSVFNGLGERIKARLEPLSRLGDTLKPFFASISEKFKDMEPAREEAMAAIKGFFGKIFHAIIDGINNLDFSTFNFNGIFDSINAGLFGVLLVSINNFVKNGSSVFDGIKGIFQSVKALPDSVSGTMAGIRGVLDETRTSLKAWQESLRADMLLKIAGAVGILAISLIALSMVDSAKLTISLGAVTALFGDLVASIAVMEKVSGPTSGAGVAKVVGALVAMSLAILLLAGAVALVAKLDQDELTKGLVGISVMTGLLIATSRLLAKNTAGMLKGAISLILFSVAVRLLVGAVEKLGALDPARLTNGLIGLGVVLAELAIFMKKTDLSGMGIAKAVGILILAAALTLMSKAVAKFGEMNLDVMGKGLVVIALILSELTAFSKLTNDSKSIISTAIGLVILGGAMLIFAEAVSRMGKLTWEEIAKGLITLGVSLALVAGAMNLMPPNMIVTSLGLLVVAGSLIVLAGALKIMGGMTWEEIARGLVLLGGSMLIIAAGMYAMAGGLPGAAAMIVMAGALAILAPILLTLGSMSLTQIGLSLLMLAGVFVVIGLAGLVLAPLIPVLLGLAAVMVLFGVAALAVGTGILAFSTGLAALALSGAAGIAALTLIVTSLIALIPMVMTKIAEGLIAFATTISNGAPAVGEALLALLRTLINVIVTITPEFVLSILNLLVTLLTTLASKIPDIVQAGFDIILGLLKGIRDNIAEVVTVTIEIVTEFIGAVSEKLPDIIQSGFDFLIAFIDGITAAIEENTDTLIESMAKLGQAIVDGMVQGVRTGAGALAEAVIDIAKAALEALKTALGINSPSKAFADLTVGIPEGSALGVNKAAYLLTDSVKDLAKGAITTMSGAIGRISDVVNANMDLAPTIRPVLDMNDVISGNRQIGKMFGDRTLNLSGVASNIGGISAKIGSPNNSTEAINPHDTDTKSITFMQNNYSPKALSAIEIYRNTQNQMRNLKGMLGTK